MEQDDDGPLGSEPQNVAADFGKGSIEDRVKRLEESEKAGLPYRDEAKLFRRVLLRMLSIQPGDNAEAVLVKSSAFGKFVSVQQERSVQRIGRWKYMWGIAAVVGTALTGALFNAIGSLLTGKHQ